MKSLSLVTLLTVAALAAPAQAAAITGHLQTSIGTNRPVVAAAAAAAEDPNGLCGDVKGYLDHAETEADKRAGTKAAEKWSKLADSWWQTGVDLSCGWAA
ncbi:MAG: hypothetical protein ABIY37_13330 [Devosia sp.]